MEPSEPLRTISVEEFKKNPELVTQLLLKEEKISLVLEKDGEVVRYAYLPTYDDEVNSILEEADSEYARREEQGYSREEAIEDFKEAHEAISKQL